MTWFDANVCIPATCDDMEIIYSCNNEEISSIAYFIGEFWINDNGYLDYDSVLRWRLISK